jgi:hypothetical protein
LWSAGVEILKEPQGAHVLREGWLFYMPLISRVVSSTRTGTHLYHEGKGDSNHRERERERSFEWSELSQVRRTCAVDSEEIKQFKLTFKFKKVWYPGKSLRSKTTLLNRRLVTLRPNNYSYNMAQVTFKEQIIFNNWIPASEKEHCLIITNVSISMMFPKSSVV